jgi:alpha-tubulin suppressor-like RCC1 family protein
MDPSAGPASPPLARVEVPSSIDVGGFRTCARDRSGVSCWGGRPGGRLEEGAWAILDPVPVPSAEGALEVAVGPHHACAWAGIVGVRCWGRGERGELGDGSRAGSAVARSAALHVDPAMHVCVGGEGRLAIDGATLVLEDRGGGHTCAIAGPDAEVWCWGANDRGQLGDGTTEDRPLPRRVIGLRGAQRVACGGAHTCAIDGDGRLRCWGDNARGQLGLPPARLEFATSPWTIDVFPPATVPRPGVER